MPRSKIIKKGSFFVDFSSSCRRETIHIAFLYLIFLSYCSPVARSQDVKQTAKGNCVFGIKKEGQRLDAMVYKYINVLFPMDCAVHCFREFCCRSANFRNIPVSDSRGNCELLHAIAEEEPGKLKTNDIYDYLVVGRGEPFNCICSPCENDGKCSGTSKKCSCSPGYNGKRCQNDINECTSNPCDTNATCTNSIGSYTCECKGVFSGDGNSCTALCAATFNSHTGTFTSPNYPNNFENNQDCSWLIVLPPLCKVRLTFEDFVMEVKDDCRYDKVVIFDGGSRNATKQIFCGINNPGVFTGSTNSVFITFHSDSSKVYKGFKVNWSAASPCS